MPIIIGAWPASSGERQRSRRGSSLTEKESHAAHYASNASTVASTAQMPCLTLPAQAAAKPPNRPLEVISKKYQLSGQAMLGDELQHHLVLVNHGRHAQQHVPVASARSTLTNPFGPHPAARANRGDCRALVPPHARFAQSRPPTAPESLCDDVTSSVIVGYDIKSALGLRGILGRPDTNHPTLA